MNEREIVNFLLGEARQYEEFANTHAHSTEKMYAIGAAAGYYNSAKHIAVQAFGVTAAKEICGKFPELQPAPQAQEVKA